MITRMKNELGIEDPSFLEVLENERKCREGLQLVEDSSGTYRKLWEELVGTLITKSRLEMGERLSEKDHAWTDMVFSHRYPENDDRPEGYRVMARSIQGKRINYLIDSSMRENPHLLRLKRLSSKYEEDFAYEVLKEYPEQIQCERFVHEYDKFILGLVDQTINTP